MVFNDRTYDLHDPIGHIRWPSLADIQLLMPAKYRVSLLLDIKAFGWACKYTNDPSLMPDLKREKSSEGNVQTLDTNVKRCRQKVDKNVKTAKHKYGLLPWNKQVIVRIVVIRNTSEITGPAFQFQWNICPPLNHLVSHIKHQLYHESKQLNM